MILSFSYIKTFNNINFLQKLSGCYLGVILYWNILNFKKGDKNE